MSRLLDSERQLYVQNELKPWAGMADRGRSAVNDSIQVCQIWRFDNMCPNDRRDRPPLLLQTISHAGHAMLQAAIGQKEELFSTKEFRLKCDDRLLVFCAEMQETENIWHAEPKVAEICNSGAHYILSMLFYPSFLWHFWQSSRKEEKRLPEREQE